MNQYCEEHSSAEPALLKELTAYTWQNTVNPRMLSGHLQGRFLSMISKLCKPETILELGTFTGYSAICLAEGLKKDGRLITLEADREYAFKAAEFFRASAFARQIEVICGQAAEIIPGLKISPDLVFVDADKNNYGLYLELCLRISHSGTLLLFDNTLWSGKVADEAQVLNDTETAMMDRFNKELAAKPGLEVVQLPLRDGLTLVRVI